MNVTSDPKKANLKFDGVAQEILQETSPRLSPEERDQLRREREAEGMMEFYGGARLNSMVAYLKSNSINKIRSREIYLDLEIDQIDPMPGQPRRYFDQEALEDLKVSIAEKGLSTPILVRRHGERYELIAGERRWRAFRELGRKKIPAIIKEVKDEKEAYILSAIENLQRENLNVVEEALCYQRMLDTGAVSSQKELAAVVGRNKSKISERLSLLKLPEAVKEKLCMKGGHLTEGHAIEILRLKEEDKMVEIADRVMTDKMSRDELRREIHTLLGRPIRAVAESVVVETADAAADEEDTQSVPLDVSASPVIAQEDHLPQPGEDLFALLEETPLTPRPLVETVPVVTAAEELELGEFEEVLDEEDEEGFAEADSTVHASLRETAGLVSAIQFLETSDQGFDLIYRFRPRLHREEGLKQIIQDLSRRVKQLKKLRKELRRAGVLT